jgi:thiamine biosynthesis lipoprotein
MNRRQFFHRHLVRSTAGVLDAVDGLRFLEDRSEHECSLLRFSRRAMATLFEVLLPLGTANAHDAAQAVLDEVDRLEAQLTVYREDSEVSVLNRRAFAEDVRVEPNLFALLGLASRLHAETDGAFDISVGALIQAWGFYRRQGRVPEPTERAEVMTRIGMQHVALEGDTCSVRFLTPGLQINLGSIGKGYAIDRAADLLRQSQVGQALIHGGHSSIYALGSEPGSRGGWRIGITDPSRPGRRVGVLRLRDRALGTSAATFQHLQYNGRKLGHILDPRTGWPTEGMLGASVAAPSAAQADALATAFFILGVDRARDYCAKHADVGAVLFPEGATRPVVIGIEACDIEMTACV